MNAFLPDATGGLNSLSQIGISFQKDGTLQLDSGKLNAVLNDPAKNIAAFFTNQPASTPSPTLGFTGRLDRIIEGMLQNDGLLDGRMDGINASIKDIGKQREAFTQRLEDIEKRYRAQFTALDTLIAGMTQTSSFYNSSYPTYLR